MIINIIVISFAVLAFLIGCGIGVFKGFVNVLSWAAEYVVAALLTIAVGAILNAAHAGAIAAGIVTIVLSIVFMIACFFVMKLLRAKMKKAFAKRDEDMRPYGAIGVLNRIFGALVLGIKGFLIAMIAVVPVLIVFDFAQISALEVVFGSFYNGALWGMIKPLVFDFIVIGLIHAAIRYGFTNGIISAAWAVLVVVFIGIAAFMSYNLVFSTEVFNGASSALGARIGDLAGASAGSAGELGSVLPENLSYTLAQWIITAGLFVLLTIVIIVASIFISRALNFARLGTIFYIADGILGAIAFVMIALVAMLILGYIIQPLWDLDFMARFTGYFGSSTIAKYFYIDNILIRANVPVLIPLRDWLS